MEAIILGNPYDIVQGSTTPIEVPAYEAEKAVIQLSDGYDPYIIGTGTADQYWFRYDTGLLRPLTESDSVSMNQAFIGQLQLGSTIPVSSILDEDDMHSDSNTALATQQSIKAYVDSKVYTGLQPGDNVSLLVNDAGYIIEETDPIFTASPAGSIQSTDITNWNTAYGWGNHASAGYLTEETDPVFISSPAYSITNENITNWSTAYSWGDHSQAGYITSETDPIFSASSAASIVNTDIVNWNAAYSALHTHSNYNLLQSLVSNGDGTKALFDDGTYKTILSTVAGGDGQIQYNNAGQLGASADLTFDSVSATTTATNLTVSTTLGIGNSNVNITRDTDGNMVFVDEVVESSVTLSELIGGVSVFQSPTGYTATTSTVGGISSGTTVDNLNGKQIVEVLQMMMFPTPSNPVFVNPTESINLTLGTSSNFSGLYVIKGSSSAMTIVDTFTSGNGPGGKSYALTNGSPIYTVNSSSFSNGDTVDFTGSTYEFKVSQAFKANGQGESDPEFVTLPNGTTVYANQYTGYTPGSITASKTYTTVDPTYYGAFTAGTSTYNSVPTWTEISDGTTKLIGPEPSTLTINITTYSGTVDTHKYILIAYPDSYGALSHIYYQEGGNNDVIGSFLNTTATYTRPDTTTVTYRIYYALNSYAGETTPRTLHYTVYF